MTTLRFSRLADHTPCQHHDCRAATKGPRQACYRVLVGELRPITRLLCVNHSAALAAEHGAPFPPVSIEDTP